MTTTDINTPAITVKIDGPLGWVLINSPDKLNSLNEEMWASLPKIIKELDQNKDIRAILFRGVGEKAFSAYLGDDRSEWLAYDASALLAQAAYTRPILIDQGGADNFLDEQLMPDRLAAAAAASGTPIEIRMQAGYDHSYFFIASFIEDHIAWHLSD